MKPLSSTFRSEASGDAGLGPVELFDIFLDSETLHFVNYDKNIVFNSPTGDIAVTYTPFPILREVKRARSDMGIDAVVIRAQNVDLAMSSYVGNNDFRGRRVVIRKVFPQYVSNSGDVAVVVDGYIERISVNQEALEAEVVPKQLGTLRVEGPRRWYQVLCNWKFAESGSCANGVSQASLLNPRTGTVGAGSTTSRIIDSTRTEGAGKTGNGEWVDGEMEILTGVLAGTKRKVIHSASGNFDLDLSLTSVPATGVTYQIKRGCDKSLYRCSGDHANQINFGGFSTIPQQEVIR